jgi:hypothetical protein
LPDEGAPASVHFCVDCPMPVGSPGQMQSVIAKGGICDNYRFEALDIG